MSGSFRLDANIKISGQDLYLTLRDYSLEVGTDTASDREELATQMKLIKSFLDTIKGKTVHQTLPTSGDEKIDQKAILSKLKDMLGILETSSILTPFKKINGVYTLVPKKETIDTLAAVFDETVGTQDFESMKKDFILYPLFFEKTNSAVSIFTHTESDGTTGDIRLTRTDSYELTIHMKKKGSDFTLLANNHFAE